MPGIEQEISEIKTTLAVLGSRVDRLEDRATPVSAPSIGMTPPPPTPILGVDEKTSSIGPKPPPESTGKIESAVTGKWFAIIGVVALIFGVSFFLKFAFENNLIGVTGRVMLGLAAGLALLITGDYLARRESYRAYAFYLTGGGLALLYLSVYAAFGFYHLIGQAAAFSFMILVTAGGAALSLRFRSERLAGLALIGGFLTPLLLSRGADQHVILFTYLLILDLGFLAVSAFRRFPRLSLLALVGTALVFSAWYSRFYQSLILGPTILFLTIAFLIFLIAPILRSIVSRRANSGLSENILAALNAAAYFGLGYHLLLPFYEPYLGFFFVIGAAIYLALGALLSAVNPADRPNLLALSGVGLVLATVAAPVQLTGQWITIAWAVEGLILTIIGFRLASGYLRAFSLIVLTVMVVRLVTIDRFIHNSPAAFVPIGNGRFFTFLVGALAFFAAAYFYYRHRDSLQPRESKVPAALGVAGNLLLALTGSQEISASVAATNLKSLLWSLLWTAHAAVLMVAGIIWRFKTARQLAIAGLAVVIAKVFLVDIARLSDLYRIVSFISLSAVLLVLSFLSYRFRDTLKRFLLE